MCFVWPWLAYKQVNTASFVLSVISRTWEFKYGHSDWALVLRGQLCLSHWKQFKMILCSFIVGLASPRSQNKLHFFFFFQNICLRLFVYFAFCSFLSTYYEDHNSETLLSLTTRIFGHFLRSTWGKKTWFLTKINFFLKRLCLSNYLECSGGLYNFSLLFFKNLF